MKELIYRIIFKKLHSKNADNFIRYISKEFDFSKKKAELILNSPPAILCESPSKNIIKTALKNFKALDARVSVQRVIKDERLPFNIDQWQLKWISKLLNMTLRVGVDSALLYVMVQPETKGDELIPLTGKESEIEKGFRESDSVYVVDDNKILFLGFTTDENGIEILIPKIIQNIKNVVQQGTIIKISHAIFPRDGYSFYELIHVIQKKLTVNATPKKESNPPSFSKKSPEESKHSHTLPIENSIYKTLFNNARGSLFNQLITMDLELLWDGLRKLSLSDQTLFCLRLPYNSPLTTILSERIKSQTPSKKKGIDTKKRMEGLFSTLDFEKKQTQRKKNQTAVIAKLDRLESLSTIPSVAIQIYNVAMDPKSGIDDIQEILQLDQVMTLKILKLVNASFYGLSQKVTSVKEAVIILGTDEIINMAFGLSLTESFKGPGLKGLIDPKALWKHSVKTALIGKYLCRGKKKFADDGIFAACILHDFGKLFLIENFPDEYRKIFELSKELNLPIYDLEEEVFGYNHGGIGGIIAKKWNLPESLVQAISFHHHPSSSESHADLAAITGFANYLCSLDEKKDLPKITFLLKDHFNILESVLDDFTINSIEDAVKNSKIFLEENKAIFSFFS